MKKSQRIPALRQGHRAAASTLSRRVEPAALHDKRVSSAVQRQLIQSVQHTQRASGASAAQLYSSPRLIAQRERLTGAFGGTVQRQGPEEDELMQGKSLVTQSAMAEEEELVQGQFDAPLQRQGDLEEEELLQGRFATVQRQGPEDEELLQGRFAIDAATAQLAGASAAEFSANRTGMPDALKAGIESLSGMDMSAVRVHENSPKPAQLNALAYAQGSDIHLSPGQAQHLPHEAWHVVQQRQGRVQATTQLEGTPVNDDDRLEREADAMGAKAQQAGQRQVAQRRAATVSQNVPTTEGMRVLQALFETIPAAGGLKSVRVKHPNLGLTPQLNNLILRLGNGDAGVLHQSDNVTGAPNPFVGYLHDYGNNAILAISHHAHRYVNAPKLGDVNKGVHRF